MKSKKDGKTKGRLEVVRKMSCWAGDLKKQPSCALYLNALHDPAPIYSRRHDSDGRRRNYFVSSLRAWGAHTQDLRRRGVWKQLKLVKR
jgi:hypothetical protein